MKTTRTGFLAGMFSGMFILGLGMLMGLGLSEPSSDDTSALISQPQPNVQTQRLEIVDEAGTVVMVIGANEQGGSLAVKNRWGHTVMLLSAAEQGGALVVNQAETMKPAFIATATSTGGAFQVMNRDGSRVVDMTAHENGGRFNLADQSGARRIAMSITEQGAGDISTFNQLDVMNARIFADVAGAGALETYRKTGERIISLTSTVEGQGQINTYGTHENEKPLITLTATANNEGQIYTYDHLGFPMIALASRTTGASLRVFNQQGKPVITLEPDDTGTGEVGLWRGDGSGKSWTP